MPEQFERGSLSLESEVEFQEKSNCGCLTIIVCVLKPLFFT